MFSVCSFSCPLPLAEMMVCWQELEQQPWAQRFKLCLEVVSVSTLGPPTSELGEREINLILFDLVAAWIVPRLVSL